MNILNLVGERLLRRKIHKIFIIIMDKFEVEKIYLISHTTKYSFSSSSNNNIIIKQSLSKGNEPKKMK